MKHYTVVKKESRKLCTDMKQSQEHNAKWKRQVEEYCALWSTT